MAMTPGMKIYNDGSQSRYFLPGTQPEGWVPGDILHEHICKHCNRSFSNDKRYSKYCDECKESLQYSEGKTCKVCGQPIKNTRNICDNPECKHICQTQMNPLHDPEIHKKRIATILERYGKDYYETHWRKKMESTMEERYGVKHALESPKFKAKAESTIQKTGISYRFHTPEWNEMMLKKYGTTIPNQHPELGEKRIQTLIDRYGVRAPAQLDYFQAKMRKTCLERYGVEYVFQDEGFKEHSRQVLLEKYGVENALFLNRRVSKINRDIGEFLEVDSYEFPLGQKQYDLKKGNCLIEVNPIITHSIDETVFGSRDKNYHQDKTQWAREHGYDCINIWQWDDLQKIKYFFQKSIIIYARKCDLIEVSKHSADEFLNNYHLQNSCTSDRIRIGLAYDNKLVGIMTFGDSRYSTKHPIELLRLCFHPDYKIIGGSERMFKYFVSTYHPSSIVSYCDKSKFSGKVYTKLGMELVDKGSPSIHWYNEVKNLHFTDNLLRQRGADQLIGTSFGKGTDNIQIMLDNGYLRIADCGQSTYVWQPH